MSWDLCVFAPNDLEAHPEDGTVVFRDGWVPPEMGPAEVMRARVAEVLPAVDWADPAWGTVDGPGFSLEFNMGPEEVLSNFMIHARGDATPAMVALTAATGWYILDTTTGKWLHTASHPDEGRAQFQAYADKVLAPPAVAEAPPGLFKRILGWVRRR